MLKHLLISAGIFFISGSLFSQDSSTKSTQLRQFLEASSTLGQLEKEGAPAFHLAASFELFTPDGKSAGQGTLDKLWKDSHHYRLDIELPTGSLVEVDDGTNPWRTGVWSFNVTIQFAENAVLTPFIESHFATDRLSEENEQNGSVKLDCIATEPELPGVSADAKVAQTTYCLAKGNHLLRLINRPNNWTIAFNDIKSFENEYIARSIEIARQGKTSLRLHVDSLTKAEQFSALNAAPPAGAQMLAHHRADFPYLSGEVMHGTVIKTSQPLLPTSGRKGDVVLKLHVDTAGSVSSAEVVSSPNEFLSAAALSSVKQWRYRLSYVNDQVVSTEETVTLRF
jgi:TonB family protein